MRLVSVRTMHLVWIVVVLVMVIECEDARLIYPSSPISSAITPLTILHQPTEKNQKLEDFASNDVKVVDEKTGIKYNPYSKHHPGRHVCTTQRNVTYPVKTKQAFCKPTYKKYRVRCGDQWCSGVKLVYEKYYKEVVMSQQSYQNSYACCPGWIQIAHGSHGCNKPHCAVACMNGGTCVRPNTCICPPGFEGVICEKVARFYIPYNCLCKNGGTCNPSSGRCTCPLGFAGIQCENDIDECRLFKPCDQMCYNTLGSFKCECKEDFSLASDGQSCVREDAVQGLGGGNDNTAFEAKSIQFENIERRLEQLESKLNESAKNSVRKEDLAAMENMIDKLNSTIAAMSEKVESIFLAPCLNPDYYPKRPEKKEGDRRSIKLARSQRRNSKDQDSITTREI